MKNDEIVARFLDAASGIWGRVLTDAAADAYMAVAEGYPAETVQAACDGILRSSSAMPTPSDLGGMLRESNRTRECNRLYLPPKVERAGREVARKAVEEFFRKTGQKRRGK